MCYFCAKIHNTIKITKTKQMKKLTQSVLAILVVASSITACKKGDDDPGLSLKSRKGRLSQAWTVSEFKDDVTDINTSIGTVTVTNTTKSTTTISGSNATLDEVSTTAAAGSTSTTTDKITGTVTSFKYTFEKDGTWSSERIIKWTSFTRTEAGQTNTSAINYTETTIRSGNWSFLGKNASTEDKNKENVLLSITKEQTKYDYVGTSVGEPSFKSDLTETFANNEKTEIWHLSRLAGDELVADATMDYTENGSDSETEDGVTTSTTVGPNSSKGTISITMAAE
jgi:hypothetical protein